MRLTEEWRKDRREREETGWEGKQNKKHRGNLIIQEANRVYKKLKIEKLGQKDPEP